MLSDRLHRSLVNHDSENIEKTLKRIEEIRILNDIDENKMGWFIGNCISSLIYHPETEQ